MKTRKWPSLCMAILTALCTSSCQDWGEMDPAAGNQIYPKLELVATYTFEEELEPTVIQPFAYSDGDTPTLVNDEERKGNVLYLNNGYARIANPLNAVKVQNGVSLTFWIKQDITFDEEGKEQKQDLEGALFSFQNSNATHRMFFTANGWLSYEGVDGTFEDNNPTTTQTGLMSAGEWHKVAIAVTNDGYFVYVDGLKKIERTITEFDSSKIVQFMASVPYLYIGYGSDAQTRNFRIDDLNVYRNIITSKEWSMPVVTDDGDDFEYQFPPANTMGYYMLDNSFANSINPSQGGEFITVEPQGTPSAFEEDAVRGTVWHQQEGWTGHANGWAYTSFSNPMKNVELTDGGLTLVMWINPPVINWWDQIFVLNDGTSKFWINALGYVGYNGGDTGNGYFDCHNNNNTNEMKAGEWTMFTLVMKADEFTVYYNDEVKFTNTENGGYGGITNYQFALDLFTSANEFFLGYETFWKAAPALVDDIFLISRPVSANEVKYIYQDTKKSNGGIVENPSYIPETTVGWYLLDGTFDNQKNTSQSGEFITVEPQGTPSAFEEDPIRGTVWHQQEGWTGHANGWAYTRFNNPMRGATLTDGGLSLSMWINPPTINWWDQIFVLNDGTSKFWINALGYVGYNGTGGFFDCHNNNNTNEMKAGEWTMFTLVMTDSEFTVYYNGEVKFTNTENGAYAGDLSGYQNVLNMFTSANDFYFGYETWWKAAPALIDDLFLCTSPLTAKQVRALYNGTKK